MQKKQSKKSKECAFSKQNKCFSSDIKSFVYKTRYKKGFSSLFIVIILGAISLSMILSISASSVLSIKGSTDTKNSNKAKSLVNACAEVALETIRENNNYIGTDNITLDGNTCTYAVSIAGATARSIIVFGTVNGIVRNLNITTGTFNPLVVSSWQEV